MPVNLLFVCSKNKWRSPTAETIYRRGPRVNVRSAGQYRYLDLPDIIVLDIPDDYQYMSDELIEMIKNSTENILLNLED